MLHTRLVEMVNEILECQLKEKEQGNGSMNSGLCGKEAFVTIMNAIKNLIFNNKDNGHDHDK